MTPEEQASYDAVQAEKRAIGIVDQESTEEAETEQDAPKEEVQAEEVKVKTEDEETEDESDKETLDRKQVSIREYKELKKELREEITNLKKALEEAQKKPQTKEQEAIVDELEEKANKLAKELDFDPDKTRKILEAARDAAKDEKGKVSEDQLKLLETLKEEKEAREQETIFNDEWKTVLNQIKEQYPNATDEQISKAREEMDKLAHTEKYNIRDLDYILFKEKASFEKVLFSPKQKTFETGRAYHAEETEFDPTASAEKISSMSPKQFEEFERKREAYINESPREKVRILTRDDKGNAVERYE